MLEDRGGIERGRELNSNWILATIEGQIYFKRLDH